MKRWSIKVVIGAGVLALCVANRSVACGGQCRFGSYALASTAGGGCITPNCFPTTPPLAYADYVAQGPTWFGCSLSSPDGKVKAVGDCFKSAYTNGFQSNQAFALCNPADCNFHDFYIVTQIQCPEGTIFSDSAFFHAKSNVSPCTCP